MKIYQAIILILLTTLMGICVGGIISRYMCPEFAIETPIEKALKARKCPECDLSICPICEPYYITEPCPVVLEPDPFADTFAFLEDKIREQEIIISQQEQLIETQRGVIEVQNRIIELRE